MFWLSSAGWLSPGSALAPIKQYNIWLQRNGVYSSSIISWSIIPRHISLRRRVSNGKVGVTEALQQNNRRQQRKVAQCWLNVVMAFRVSFAVLAAILIAQEHVSARQFTAECLKDHQTGEFLCATTAPDAQVAGPQGMTGHIGCTMSCTLDEQCQHFNYVPTAPMPCQLFYTEPTTFTVQHGCEHYRSPSTGASRNFHAFNAVRGRSSKAICIILYLC